MGLIPDASRTDPDRDDDADQWPRGLMCPNIPPRWHNQEWCYGKVYAMNYDHSEHPGWRPSSKHSVQFTRIKFPSEVVQMVDGVEWKVRNYGARRYYWDNHRELTYRDGPHPGDAVMYRHPNTTADFLHFDGHVERLRPEEAYSSIHSVRMRMWRIY